MTEKIELNAFITNDLLEFVSGHFPGHIIIPGAVLLEVVDKAITNYLQSKLNRGYKLRYIQQAIFYSVLNNLCDAYFIFNIEQQSLKVLDVDGVIKIADNKIVKVRMNYEKNNNCHI